MTAIEHLLAVATEYGRAEDVDASVVSWRAFGDSKKLPAIRDGKADVHTRRYERVMRWFSENWPQGAVWPKGVKRPEARRQQDAA